MPVGCLGPKGGWRTSGHAWDRFASDGLSLGRVGVGDLFVMWANCGLVFDGPAVTSWSDNIGVTAEDGLVLLIGFEAAGDVVVRPAPGAYEPCVLVYKIPNPMVLLPSPPA